MSAESPTRVTYAPALATLVDEPPDGPDWLHEIKFDGYRMGLVLERGRPRWKSRHGKNWTAALPELVLAARELNATSAVLDGELAVLLPNGLTSFEGLQRALHGAEDSRHLTYFAFDLLHLDGRDLTKMPLEQRKERLRELLDGLGTTHPIKFTDHIIGEGALVFERASTLGVEGIVSKRRRSIYRAGRTRDWLKTKCWRTQNFVVCGYVESSAGTSVREILIGHYDPSGVFHVAGSVGTGKGFTSEFRTVLRRELGALSQIDAPLRTDAHVDPTIHWVAPILVAQIAFTETMSDGYLRHPSFRGFQPGVSPREVVIDRAPRTSKPDSRLRIRSFHRRGKR